MTMYQEARRYAERGFDVFPLTPGSKKPLAGSNGLTDATQDPDQLWAWWGSNPERGLGIATGQRSGVVVVDVDDLEQMGELKRRGPLPSTLTARTPKGGLHLYYAAPSVPIRNSVRERGWLKQPGIDVRGDGGYVVGPPTETHADGQGTASGRYSWVSLADVAPFPEWLAALHGQQTTPAAADVVQPGPLPSAGHDSDRWGATCLEQELAKLMAAAPGERNDTLYHAALKVGGAVKGGHLDDTRARKALAQVAERIGLAVGETHATIESAFVVAEERHPQERPERVQVGTGVPAAPRVETPAPQPAPDVPTAASPSGMLTLDDLDNLPPLEWLIPGQLPAGLNMLFGPYGGGKTFLALDWSLALASGALGKQRTVVYQIGEGVSGFRSRISAWLAHHPYLERPTRSFYTRASIKFTRLTDPESVADLCRDLDAMPQPPELMVVDTLARSLAGGEEGSHEFGRTVAVCDDLRNRYGMSTLLVHHSGVNPDRERGHTSLGAACDSVFHLRPPDDTAWGLHSLECVKMKDGQKPDRLEVKMNAMHGSVVFMPSTAERVRRAYA